jgi:ribosome maturation factor RimP
MKIKENYTMRDALSDLLNKKVEIILKSGKNFNGKIQTVGQHCMVLNQLGSRSFFDVIIQIEDIAAVEVQIRTN